VEGTYEWIRLGRVVLSAWILAWSWWLFEAGGIDKNVYRWMDIP
jgi:hypothetical protein